MAKRKINPRIDHEGIPRCKSSCKWWKDGISCTHEDAIAAQPTINKVCWPAALRLLGRLQLAPDCEARHSSLYRENIAQATEQQPQKMKESKR